MGLLTEKEWQKLHGNYPLLDFSFQDGYEEELGLIIDIVRAKDLAKIGEVVEGARLTDEESADVYRQMWYDGWDEPLPCMKLRRAIAQAQLQAALKTMGEGE